MQIAQQPYGEPYARSILDAARCMGIGKSTLYQYLASGHIQAFNIGRRRLIAETEIQRFLAERMEIPASRSALCPERRETP